MSYQNTTHTLVSGRLTLFWQKWIPIGEVERVIVFQHGIGEHSDRYQQLIHAFAGTGSAFYAVELRGHGRSEGIRGHAAPFAAYAEDLGCVVHIARQEYRQKIFLLGHSMGGAVALLYTLQNSHQDHLRGLLLSSPAIEMPLDASGRFKKQLASVLAGISPATVIETGLDTRYLSHDPAVGRDFQQDPRTHTKISFGMGHALFQLHKTFYTRAHKLRIPTYIFHGTADRITSPEGSKKLYQLLRQKDKTLRLYEGLYHETMHEQEPMRSRVLQDLKAWVEQH